MELTGILIAGGKSERMGTDKTLLFYQGKTFAESAIKLLELMCSKILISSNSTELPGKHQIIKDVCPNIGPIGGLHACLKASTTTYNLVLPCDLPLMESTTLDILTREAATYQAVVFRINRLAEPLCGVYSTECIKAIEECIEQGSYSLQKLLAKIWVKYIEVDDSISYQFRNVNTPLDYCSLEGFIS